MVTWLPWICLCLATALPLATSDFIPRSSPIREAVEREELEKCIQLRDVLYNLIHKYMLPTLYDVTRDPERARNVTRHISDVMGVDVTNLSHIQKLACRMIGVQSVSELADILKVDYDRLRDLYHVGISTVRNYPRGWQDYLRDWDVAMRLGRFLRGTRFPRWPLGVTSYDTYKLVLGLVDKYDTNFLEDSVDPAGQRAQVDPFRLMLGLKEANDVDQFQGMTGMSDPQVVKFQNIGDQAVKMSDNDYEKFEEGGKSLVDFVQVTAQVGLMDLYID